MMGSSRLIWACCLFVTIWLYVPSAFADAHCETLPKTIEQDIKVRVEAIQGIEECQYRHIATGVLFPGLGESYVVLYDVEDPCFGKSKTPGIPCGNFDLQYWVVYVGTLKGYHAVAAGEAPGARISHIQIVNNKIIADVYRYAHLDPMCCPSIVTKTAFKVQNGRIVVIKH